MKTRQTPHVLSRINRQVKSTPSLAAQINGDVQIARIQSESAAILRDLFSALRPSDGAKLAADWLKRPAMPCTTARWLGVLKAETYAKVPGGPAGAYSKPIHRTEWARLAHQFRARVLDIQEVHAGQARLQT